MGSRHASRRVAAQVLYALDMNPEIGAREALDRALEEGRGEVEAEFLERLVDCAWRDRARLDSVVERFSHHWKVHRMDRVDRSILRLGAHELLDCPETPAPVILDESVELAKEFGTPESAGFVNGILDRIAREARPEEVRRRGG